VFHRCELLRRACQRMREGHRWQSQHLGSIGIEEVDRPPVKNSNPTGVGSRKPLLQLSIEVLRRGGVPTPVLDIMWLIGVKPVRVALDESARTS
jgi:hypothetical protein